MLCGQNLLYARCFRQDSAHHVCGCPLCGNPQPSQRSEAVPLVSQDSIRCIVTMLTDDSGGEDGDGGGESLFLDLSRSAGGNEVWGPLRLRTHPHIHSRNEDLFLAVKGRHPSHRINYPNSRIQIHVAHSLL